MNTNQQLEKLRRYMLGQIGTAVVGHCAPIETYRTDENAEDTIDGLYESPLTIFLGSDYHNVIRLEDGEDGTPICLMDGEDGEDYMVAVDTLSTDTLQEIVGWLTEHGFITPTTPAPIPRTCEFGDFIQRHLPNHSVRYDVFRQSELQCFIDGHEAPDFGLTRDEAITERDRLLLRIYAETIDAYTRLTPEQQVLDKKLDRIYEDEDKRDRFAELLLSEAMEDTEPYHKVGRQVIDAYRDKDCDALLLALCGWTMESLVEKI